MSELSEDLKNLITQAGSTMAKEGGATADGTIIAQPVELESDEIDVGLKQYHTNEVVRVLRRSVRWHSGKVFKDGDEAFSATQDKIIGEFIPVLVTACADFMQVGSNAPVVLLHRITGTQEHLATNLVFRSVSEETTLRFMSDDDVMTLFDSFVRKSTTALAYISGYLKTEDAETPDIPVSKIWDLWIMSLRSALTSFAVIGKHIGEEWKKRELHDSDKLVLKRIAEQEFKDE
jgi:hypothetical protein